MSKIDKLDGMVKIKGKCGYEIIGGCRELRKAKAKLEKIKEYTNQLEVFTHIKEDLLNIIEGVEDE